MALGMLGACHKDQPSFPTEPRFIEDVFGSVNSRWVAPQTLWSWSQPVVDGNVVVFASGDLMLTAHDRISGAVKWATRVSSVNVEQRISGQNLLVRGGVVVAAISRNVVGVDMATGAELWSYGAPTDTLVDPPGKPATVELVMMDADDSTVYIPAWGASISAVNVRTGVARWIWRPAPGTQLRSGAHAVQVRGDTIVATVWHQLSETGSAEGWVVTIDRRNGQELARATIPPYTIGNPFRGRPILWNNVVIVSGTGGRLWAVNQNTNAIAWTYAPTAGIGATVGGPELQDDILYADGGDGYVVALRVQDGSVVWRARILGPTIANIHVSSKRVYASTGGFLNIIDRATGKFVARIRPPIRPADGDLFSSAAVSAGGQVYITINRGAWCFDEP